jgi:voltage-gated potassium channel
MLKKLKKFFPYDREKYENILDDKKSSVWILLNRFITILVILFIIAFTFESIWENKNLFYREFFIFEAFISTIFALEYFYRLLRAKNKFNFFISPIRIIDLLSFLPFFLWFFTAWSILKILRIFRVFRVFKLLKKIPLTNWFIKSLKDYLDEYKAIFLLFFVILFIGSFFVYFVEKDVVWTKFTSIPITLWWGLVTMTTVWFWDMYPMTTLWKIFWSFLVFLWPLVLALASAITIMVFVETSKQEELSLKSKKWKICPRCKVKNVKDANFCYKCWKKIDK